MDLQPIRPPGRTDRKVGAYATDIRRLRAEGYTFEAIREALAAIGIEASVSALRREVRRLGHAVTAAHVSSPPAEPQPAWTAAHLAPAVPAASPATPLRPTGSGVPRGREIAEAFFAAHPSNPLFDRKDTP
jgi:hypothetical protein